MNLIDNKVQNMKTPQGQSSAIVAPDYFSKDDIDRFKTGAHHHLYKKLGCHLANFDNKAGAYFSVWAPNAKKISVIGDFNDWDKQAHHLYRRVDHSGIWEGFIPDVKQGDFYKYHIVSNHNGYKADKADPFAFRTETPPLTASVVYNTDYQWNDAQWLSNRRQKRLEGKPESIYELHLGSWRRRANNSFKNYRELADELVEYIKKMGFTHIELMPVMEHPFYGSWGYQALSYFAPTSRYGSPEELKYLIDTFHQNDIGVILDWVVSHFPSDEHGLANFDGTQLYECGDVHPDWQSCTFNYGRHEVAEFLISSAMFWIDEYHVDGIRVDAVASMLYLDYSRREGEWKPNIFGGRENLEAVSFVRNLNEAIESAHPDVQLIAEDSTAWPKVSRPTSDGGLNFDMKWNMGWMHDTLKYFSRENKERGKFNEEVTFCLYYAFSENFLLPLSHDEVVYEKGSMIGKMPGNDWEQFANLRALYGYMFGHPGKKLLFMGAEIAQWSEWNHEKQLEWGLLRHDRHKYVQKWVRDLNQLYRNETALHELDFSPNGFEWLDMGYDRNAIFSFLRKSSNPNNDILVICNFKNRGKRNYKVGIPTQGMWHEILSSEDSKYGGKGGNTTEAVESARQPWPVKRARYSDNISYHMKEYSLSLDIPPLSVSFYKKC